MKKPKAKEWFSDDVLERIFMVASIGLSLVLLSRVAEVFAVVKF